MMLMKKSLTDETEAFGLKNKAAQLVVSLKLKSETC